MQISMLLQLLKQQLCGSFAACLLFWLWAVSCFVKVQVRTGQCHMCAQTVWQFDAPKLRARNITSWICSWCVVYLWSARRPGIAASSFRELQAEAALVLFTWHTHRLFLQQPLSIPRHHCCSQICSASSTLHFQSPPLLVLLLPTQRMWCPPIWLIVETILCWHGTNDWSVM